MSVLANTHEHIITNVIHTCPFFSFFFLTVGREDVLLTTVNSVKRQTRSLLAWNWTWILPLGVMRAMVPSPQVSWCTCPPRRGRVSTPPTTASTARIVPLSSDDGLSASCQHMQPQIRCEWVPPSQKCHCQLQQWTVCLPSTYAATNQVFLLLDHCYTASPVCKMNVAVCSSSSLLL